MKNKQMSLVKKLDVKVKNGVVQPERGRKIR